MGRLPDILICRCEYAQVVPERMIDCVLAHLARNGVEARVVGDLCELAAREGPLLREFANRADPRVVACFPRAVRWLFAAAGADLPEHRVVNMRTGGAEDVVRALENMARASRVAGASGPEERATQDPGPQPPASSLPRGSSPKPPVPIRHAAWFPVIDFARCTNCMQCLSFCLFDVFRTTPERKIAVKNPGNCKADCPACSRVCPEVAIIFPKYKAAPINGDQVRPEGACREKVKVDVSSLLGGDVYSLLRQRQEGGRFSEERDEKAALEERRRWLAKLQKEMDIPSEVLASLATGIQKGGEK